MLVDSYGQESIGNLMPLVVNVLENLDSALSDNKDHMTAIEEFTHTNELLMKQYEKEKSRRKEVEEVGAFIEGMMIYLWGCEGNCVNLSRSEHRPGGEGGFFLKLFWGGRRGCLTFYPLFWGEGGGCFEAFTPLLQ